MLLDGNHGQIINERWSKGHEVVRILNRAQHNTKSSKVEIVMGFEA